MIFLYALADTACGIVFAAIFVIGNNEYSLVKAHNFNYFKHRMSEDRDRFSINGQSTIFFFRRIYQDHLVKTYRVAS